jgi:ABC-type sugar transport system ATPase subunit
MAYEIFPHRFSNCGRSRRSREQRTHCAVQRFQEATIIYVTHDQVEAMTMSTRLAMMRSPDRHAALGVPPSGIRGRSHLHWNAGQ